MRKLLVVVSLAVTLSGCSVYSKFVTKPQPPPAPGYEWSDLSGGLYDGKFLEK